MSYGLLLNFAGKWLCPWHRCNECNKRTIRRCGFCPNSFCPQHADGNIRVHPSVGLVCQEHDEVIITTWLLFCRFKFPSVFPWSSHEMQWHAFFDIYLQDTWFLY